MTKKYPIQKYYLFIFYLLVTCGVFYLSIKIGRQGVSLQPDDGVFYWEQAQQIYLNGKAGVITSIYIPIIGHILKSSFVNSPLVIRLFNWLGFILLVNNMLKLIDIIWKKDFTSVEYKEKRQSYLILIIILAFWPSMIMNVDMSIFRDVWIYLLYLLATIESIELFLNKKYTLFTVFKLLFYMYMLGEFRKYALLAFICGTFACVFVEKFIKIKKKMAITVFAIVVVGVVYTIFFNRNIPIVNMSLASALSYRESAITGIYGGGSQMYISLYKPNFILFMINYAYSFIGNLIGPLPWHISGIGTGIVFITETIPMIAIIAFILYQYKRINIGARFILVQAIVWNAFIAISNDNVGAATRLRIISWIFILCVFCVLMANYIKINNVNLSCVKLYIKNKLQIIRKFSKNIVASYKIKV